METETARHEFSLIFTNFSVRGEAPNCQITSTSRAKCTTTDPPSHVISNVAATEDGTEDGGTPGKRIEGRTYIGMDPQPKMRSKSTFAIYFIGMS